MTTVILLTLGVTLSADISGGCGPEKKPPVDPTEWRTAKVEPVVVGPDAKVEARPLVGRYAAIYERVASGQTVYLSVGSDLAGFERCDDVPPSLRPGLYRCFPSTDGPAIEPAVISRPAAFPVLRAFTGGT